MDDNQGYPHLWKPPHGVSWLFYAKHTVSLVLLNIETDGIWFWKGFFRGRDVLRWHMEDFTVKYSWCVCVCVCLAFFGHETMCVYLFKPGVFFHVLGVLKTCFFHHQTDGLKHCALGGPRNPWLTGHCRKELYQPVPFARLPSCFQMDLYDSQRCLKPPHLFKFHGSNEYQTSMPQS